MLIVSLLFPLRFTHGPLVLFEGPSEVGLFPVPFGVLLLSSVTSHLAFRTEGTTVKLAWLRSDKAFAGGSPLLLVATGLPRAARRQRGASRVLYSAAGSNSLIRNNNTSLGRDLEVRGSELSDTKGLVFGLFEPVKTTNGVAATFSTSWRLLDSSLVPRAKRGPGAVGSRSLRITSLC